MKEKTVGQAYTQIDKVYAIDVDGLLSREVLQQVCIYEVFSMTYFNIPFADCRIWSW